MGAIVDVLMLDRSDHAVVKMQYPGCTLINKTNTGTRVQEYHLVIPDGELFEERYYLFLLDNLIAMSSRNFQSRYSREEMFRARMKARADANLREMRERASNAVR